MVSSARGMEVSSFKSTFSIGEGDYPRVHVGGIFLDEFVALV